ncbi:MAG: ABC transporter permease [Synergistaceae bacterium]|jgi:simple sugar transport system permease protein|nr:ABC transporter permease [Synergistaceae bacterium]
MSDKNVKKDGSLYILLGLALALAVVFAAVFGESMYSARNLRSMAYQMPEFGLLALGMMLAFLIGGIDLSIVAIANTSGIMAALVLTGAWMPGLSGPALIAAAVATGLTAAVIFGLFNGFLITKLSASPIIATLGTMTFYSGIGMALTGGKGITGLPSAFTSFGTAEVFGVPVIFVCFVAVAAALSALLSRTALGRRMYLYGENPLAARFSAIDIEKIGFWVYGVIGLLAGMSGHIIISRVNSAKVGYGDAYQLQALLVCVIGGIHPQGGRGKALGVVCAVILMQMLSSAFTIWQFSPYAKKLIWGSMLIVMLGLEYLSEKRTVRRELRQKVVN